jgi:hypothetical protein
MPLPLTFHDSEQLSVSTITVITEAKYERSDGQPYDGYLRASIQHIAGGAVYYTTESGVSALAAGTAGEHKLELGDTLIVKGQADIKALSLISVSGEAAATLQVLIEKGGS